MTRWAPVMRGVDAVPGRGGQQRVPTTVRGARETAVEHVAESVAKCGPEQPEGPLRMRRLRMPDGWPVIGSGSKDAPTRSYRFTRCEMEWDSGPFR